MKLIFLYGPPAVGKLTVAQELARTTGYKVFHNHLTVDLVTSLFPFGSEPFVKLREEIWLAVLAEAAQQDLSLIFTFNPERSVRSSFIQNAKDTIESKGSQIVFVELTCDEMELERRMEQLSRKQFGKLASVEQYRALTAEGAFQFPTLPQDLSVDTTAKPPAETAREIAEYVAARAV